jgi:RecA-superfamily ATPases implicated in signal transduction
MAPATEPLDDQTVASGSPHLDRLVGGGLAVGTSTLITGAAGTGKSVLCTQYGLAAARRGERVHFFLFDERVSTFLTRAEALGMSIRDAKEKGLVHIHQVEPTQMSPGEFADTVRTIVERDDARVIVVDSINGYMQAMPSERLLTVQVHELLSYLANRDCAQLRAGGSGHCSLRHPEGQHLRAREWVACARGASRHGRTAFTSSWSIAISRVGSLPTRRRRARFC